MKVINTKKLKRVIEVDNPYAFVATEPEKIKVKKDIIIHTVVLKDEEFIKVKQVLSLTPKQYKKFVKKFKIGYVE